MGIVSLQGTDFPEIREEVAKLCQSFPDPYWRQLDRDMAQLAHGLDQIFGGL